MEKLKDVLDELITDNMIQAVLSNPLFKEKGTKVKVRPVLIQEKLLFQETLYRENKVFHCNCTTEEIKERMLLYIQENFRQMELFTPDYAVTALISRKGKITVKKRRQETLLQAGQNTVQSAGSKEDRPAPLAHNRTRRYILEEGKPVDFLIGLGVQTKDGRIVKARYDKFRQINRYLEFVEDIVKQLPQEGPVRIIDFGCGKSYLTFAMYYYLHVLRGYDVKITGLDLKADVIELCNKLAEEYHYEQLHFEKGDISTYAGEDCVDMVVTLHACDTATDYALEKAIRWGAKVIMAVPCCQHEVNRQIANSELNQILKYGLIKEKLSALLTDAIRARLLEEMGYDTQILEFIDMEHTPKNILIRAVKRQGMRKKKEDINSLTDFLHVKTTLQKLLEEETD